MPAADLPRSADVVVIGAGIVGCACAYYLGQAGLTTCLLDRGPIGRGASGACEDNVILSDKRRGPLLDLAKSGQDLYRELAGELPMDIHVERKGSILIGESERDRQEQKRGEQITRPHIPGPTVMGSSYAGMPRRWRDLPTRGGLDLGLTTIVWEVLQCTA